MKLSSLVKGLLCLFGFINLGIQASFAKSLEEDAHLEVEQQLILIEKLQSELKAHYVDKTLVNEISYAIEKWRKNAINVPSKKEDFIKELNESLFEFSKDKHLRVEYFPGSTKETKKERNEDDFSSEHESRMWHSQNMGFKKVERLPFNIGLMKLEAFAPLKYASPLIASSFNFVKNTDALVIDLRGNFGGYEYTAPLLASYLLEKKTHLFDMYHRSTDKLEERWSHKDIEGPRYHKEKIVYILIDKHTFSAGETFAYTLKHLKRAILVGETTAGASNAGQEFRLNKDFIAFIPTKKMINSITKKNFERKGVIPNIKTSSDLALVEAQKHYLESLLKEEKDKRRKKRISDRLNELTRM